MIATAPAAEPVTTAEAKAHLRVDHTDDDTYIGVLITAARQEAEAITRRALITQTWDAYLDAWPCGRRIALPKPKLVSVTYVKYYDTDGTLQTLSSSNYTVHAEGDVGFIELDEDATWPSLDDRSSAIVVRFVCGYGTSGSDVPARIRHAILVGVGDLYAHRESTITGTINSELAVVTMRNLLRPYTVREFR